MVIKIATVFFLALFIVAGALGFSELCQYTLDSPYSTVAAVCGSTLIFYAGKVHVIDRAWRKMNSDV